MAEELTHDVDVGVETAYNRELSLRSDVAQLQAEAGAFQSLLSSPGWKLLSTFIEETVSAQTDQLITSRDHDEMRRLQESIQALERVRTYPTARILEAEEKRQLLSEADPALSPDPSDDPADNH
jgi:hypothetical protein